MKIAQYATTVVVLHTFANGLHGLAHITTPVPLSLFQTWFVGVEVVLAPIVAVVLLWMQFYHISSWLLLGSLAGSFLFGLYNHFIVISSDHVSQVPFEGWGIVFQITAFLILIADGLGCWMSVQILKMIPQPDQVL